MYQSMTENAVEKQKLLLPISNPKSVRCKVICFPYAGGNATMFQGWQNELPPDVAIYALHAPGRATRFFEDAYNSMDRLVEDLLLEVSILESTPYILYGHSLGARVAYEFVKRAMKLGYSSPIHFIASGSRSPDTPCFSNPTFNLPKEQFIKTLRNMEGTPQEVLENDEFMELLMPTLRADFQIAEEYIGEVSQLPCSLSVLGGRDDQNIGMKELMRWQKFTQYECDVQIFEGGHFFINESNKPLKTIASTIANLVNDDSLIS